MLRKLTALAVVLTIFAGFVHAEVSLEEEHFQLFPEPFPDNVPTNGPVQNWTTRLTENGLESSKFISQN